MKYYLAPMEGITGYVYRNAYHEVFSQMDRYYTPFLVVNQHGSLKHRELSEIQPEHNKGKMVVPQLLAANGDYFVAMANRLYEEYGYEIINLNLGCPARTVVTKKKGAGLLMDPYALEKMLDGIYEKAKPKVSIKTRAGVWDLEEFDVLLSIFAKFPVEELVIHPRLLTEYYKGTPHIDLFKKASEVLPFPVCYNGDVFSLEKQKEVCDVNPNTERIMLGRGLLANPWLVDCLEGKKAEPDQEQFMKFQRLLVEGYQREMSGDKNVLYKLKELWIYQQNLFTSPERYLKKIRKADTISEYYAQIERLLNEQNMQFPEA